MLQELVLVLDAGLQASDLFLQAECPLTEALVLIEELVGPCLVELDVHRQVPEVCPSRNDVALTLVRAHHS